MVYRFILVSDEVENFRRDITIDADATFFELHEAILDSVGYAKDQITSFFICDDDWSKETEIMLIDMESSSDEDIYVMENCRLNELLDEERQKLIYVFESLTDRSFFMELREIIPCKNQEKPQTVKSVGNPPVQISAMEELDFSTTVANPNLEEDEFINDEFGMDDYDTYDDEALGDLSEDYY
jgi:hypothetical protein